MDTSLSFVSVPPVIFLVFSSLFYLCVEGSSYEVFSAKQHIKTQRYT